MLKVRVKYPVFEFGYKRWRQHTEKFHQTLNPMNTLPGTDICKSQKDIMEELEVSAKEWIRKKEKELPGAKFQII